MKPTINTFYPDWDSKTSPTREKPERTREEFQQDNKPTAETRNNGLAFVKPINPDTYRPYKGETAL